MRMSVRVSVCLCACAFCGKTAARNRSMVLAENRKEEQRYWPFGELSLSGELLFGVSNALEGERESAGWMLFCASSKFNSAEDTH